MNGDGWLHNSKPFTHMGVVYPSMAAFCRKFGLIDTTVKHRIKIGIADERLTARRLRKHGQCSKTETGGSKRS